MDGRIEITRLTKHNKFESTVLHISLTLLAFYSPVFAQGLADQVQEYVRTRIEAAGEPPRIIVRDELIYSSLVLPLFYEQRAYIPSWSDDGGLYYTQIEALVNAIKDAYKEGLTPDDYHLKRIDATLQEIRENQAKKRPYEPRRLAEFDLLLTDAFLIYAAHLLAGRVNPETIDAQWKAYRRDADLGQILQKALDVNNIEQALRNLLPAHPGYTRLREKLALYRQIAAEGGWPLIPAGPKIRKGDRDERLALLRDRLASIGDLLTASVKEEDYFDEELEQALRAFQKRHGLTVDGILGQTTLVALNVPAEKRVRQILVNMERWRWLPENLGKRYIIVNIANFELEVVENNREVLSILIIVGKPYRRTPVFSDNMTYLVLNPQWHVPQNIAVKDILPLVKKNPSYLVNNNISLFAVGSGQEIDPASVDWSRVNENNFSFTLRQAPGANNALGRIKFMFPNKHNVYIHDTPAKELFKKTERGFSSGCIRIEKPTELAEYVLKTDPKWTRAKIIEAINIGKEQTIRLPETIPVHLLYWTAWADDKGAIQFRNDIYERDADLNAALFEKPPSK